MKKIILPLVALVLAGNSLLAQQYPSDPNCKPSITSASYASSQSANAIDKQFDVSASDGDGPAFTATWSFIRWNPNKFLNDHHQEGPYHTGSNDLEITLENHTSVNFDCSSYLWAKGIGECISSSDASITYQSDGQFILKSIPAHSKVVIPYNEGIVLDPRGCKPLADLDLIALFTKKLEQSTDVILGLINFKLSRQQDASENIPTSRSL